MFRIYIKFKEKPLLQILYESDDSPQIKNSKRRLKFKFGIHLQTLPKYSFPKTVPIKRFKWRWFILAKILLKPVLELVCIVVIIIIVLVVLLLVVVVVVGIVTLSFYECSEYIFLCKWRNLIIIIIILIRMKIRT